MIDIVDKILPILSKEKEPYKKIIGCSGIYLPLQWLYCEMRKINGIPGITEYSKPEMFKYWKLTDKNKKSYVRIWQWQAMYCYDQVKELK